MCEFLFSNSFTKFGWILYGSIELAPAILKWGGQCRSTTFSEGAWSATARGVWGHAPPGKFWILDLLRPFLVQSYGEIAKLTVQQPAKPRQAFHTRRIWRCGFAIDLRIRNNHVHNADHVTQRSQVSELVFWARSDPNPRRKTSCLEMCRIPHIIQESRSQVHTAQTATLLTNCECLKYIRL